MYFNIGCVIKDDEFILIEANRLEWAIYFYNEKKEVVFINNKQTNN